MLSSGICLYFSFRNSSISSLTSPCTTISSPPDGVLVTLEPVANFLPNSLATFLSSRSKASRPETDVTYLRLFRSMRLMVTTLAARLSACFCSAASAFAVFFCASFSARFWASTERLAVEAARASVFWEKSQGQSCRLFLCFATHGKSKGAGGGCLSRTG